MGEHFSSAVAQDAAPAPPTGRLRPVVAAWVSAVCASLLVLCELLAADLALSWSLADLLELPPTVVWITGSVGAAIAVAVTAWIFRIGLNNERRLAETHPGGLEQRFRRSTSPSEGIRSAAASGRSPTSAS